MDIEERVKARNNIKKKMSKKWRIHYFGDDNMRLIEWFKTYKNYIIGYSLGYWSLNIIFGNARNVADYGWLLAGWIVTYFIGHFIVFKPRVKGYFKWDK